MTSLKNKQRIKVNADGPTGMNGMIGTVIRLRKADDGAWVRMDATLPAEHASFPIDDERRNDVILYPEECEVA